MLLLLISSVTLQSQQRPRGSREGPVEVFFGIAVGLEDLGYSVSLVLAVS